MARKALIEKQKKLAKRRQHIYEQQKIAEARWEVYVPPKNRQPTKFYNRCWATGKTRAYMREFGVSRQAFRRYARAGIIMWVRKSSW